MKRWILLALLGACSTETTKETQLVPSQSISPCPECPQCPNPPPPTPTPFPGPEKIVAAINAARKARGLNDVVEDPKLDCAAELHAMDISGTRICGHVGRDGSQFWQRAQRCGTEALGEIVACGFANEAGAVAGWNQSPGHAAIMFEPQHTRVGAKGVNGFYVAVFGQ